MRMSAVITTSERQWLASWDETTFYRSWDTAAMDVDRLRSGTAPVLLDHEPSMRARVGHVIGESVQQDAAEVRADLEIDEEALAEVSPAMLAALRSGRPQNVSVGVQPTETFERKARGEVLYHHSQSECVEVSLVPAGACRGARVMNDSESRERMAQEQQAAATGGMLTADLPGAAVPPELAATAEPQQAAATVDLRILQPQQQTATPPVELQQTATPPVELQQTATGSTVPPNEDLRILPADSPTAQQRSRINALLDFGRAHGIGVSAAIADGKTTADDLREELDRRTANLRRMRWNQAASGEVELPMTLQPPHTPEGGDDGSRWMRAASDWLLESSGIGAETAGDHSDGSKPGDGGPCRGMTARDLLLACAARDKGGPLSTAISIDEQILTCLSAAAQQQSRLFARGDIAGLERAGAGLAGQQGKTDFATLLDYSGNRVAVAGFNGADMRVINWRRWCATGASTDFRPKDYKLLGAAPPRLPVVNDQGEVQHADLTDSEEASIQTRRRGLVYGVSYESIVNDELGGLMMQLMQAGRSGQLSIQLDCIDILTANSGLGDEGDGTAIFSAARNNIGTAAAITAEALIADANIIVQQQAIGQSDRKLGRRPDVLLVPWELGSMAAMLTGVGFEGRPVVPPGPLTNQAYPTAYGIVKEVVGSEYLTGTRRYMISGEGMGMGGGRMGLRGSPIMVQFFQGRQMPYLVRASDPVNMGLSFSVQLAYTAQAITWRGMSTNAGA